MPSYLDFDSTKKFRDFIISKTLNNPLELGPRSFNNSNYTYQKLSSYPNVNPGDVVKNDSTSREEQNKRNSGLNKYKPTEYIINENLNSYVINTGKLNLYPYFSTDIPNYNLISITKSTNDTESQLFKFAVNNIKNNVNGPLLSRINQNLKTTINGKNRLLDALNGNTSTALNLVTGKESLVEFDNTITVSKNLTGKALDFTEKITGINLPISEIPGDYLSNPLSYNYNTKIKSSNEIVNIVQDIGSLIGVNRRNSPTRNPSDVLVEYMGQGPKQKLFDLLSYSKYAPNYTTKAMSQNTSKLFNFIDNLEQKTKNLLGTEAPAGKSYIGDDRGDNVKFSMSDFNGNVVKSNYFLTLMFDKLSAELFHNNKGYFNNGNISGNLTWISKNSKTQLTNENNINDTLSKNFVFREDSILNKTQELLNNTDLSSISSKSHISNVIDQTSRMFYDGDIKISKGSAIRYVDKNKEESGMEYCRVWTKDRPYLRYSNTMKRQSNLRKFDSSVIGGQSRVWNPNYAPMSNGKTSFKNSTNIDDSNMIAKKYMLSIENLAWKTSKKSGFTVSDLPLAERGPNGGRIMWFPPYDLKVTDNNTAKWNENDFLGRPEPIYTYQNSTRTGTLNFKIVVDHPSILNLLVQKELVNMTDEESENYINAFFAGCKELDFYELIQKYSMLDKNEVNIVNDFLNTKTNDKNTINQANKNSLPVTTDNGKKENTYNNVSYDFTLFFHNNSPEKSSNTDIDSNEDYEKYYEQFLVKKNDYITNISNNLNTLIDLNNDNANKDKLLIIGKVPDSSEKNNIINIQTGITNENFSTLVQEFNKLKNTLVNTKDLLSKNKIENLEIILNTSTSALGDNNYNIYLGFRRGYSLLKFILNQISNTPIKNIKWFNLPQINKENLGILELKYSYKDLGYEIDGDFVVKFTTNGEDSTYNGSKCSQNILTKSVSKLEIYSNVAYGCRNGNIKINYKEKTNNTTINDNNNNNNNIVSNNNTVEPKKIPSETLLKIISKILGEQYYFKKLEETDPIVFSSLKEKLKYFHPGFHSITPEGLNSRLTFLLQCTRPGDTIPVKGISEPNDLNARNTTFGPPPVCIIRVGDFYHSKVIIDSVNFDYDDTTWDFNPEGIGVQPMLVGVSIGLKFIGGQGLEKPVEQLQNALTSNYFANTEMYDERSINTSNINGKKLEDFTKEFLEGLSRKPQNKLKFNEEQNKKEYVTGEYIGSLNKDNLNYKEIVNELYKITDGYFNSLFLSVNQNFNDYGDVLSSLLLNNIYKTKKQYQFIGETSTINFELFGVDNDFETKLNNLITNFKNKLSNNSLSLYELFSLNKVLKKSEKQNIDISLIEFFNENLYNYFSNFSKKSNETIKTISKNRNELIKILDKLNFIMKYGYDVSIDGTDVKKIVLNSFTKTNFYSNINTVINKLKDNENKYFNYFNNFIDFNENNLTDEQFNYLISLLLNKYFDDVLNLISSNDDDKERITKKLKNFIENNNLNFKIDVVEDIIINKNTKDIQYTYTESEIVTDVNVIEEVLKLYNKKDSSTTTFNYYRNE